MHTVFALLCFVVVIHWLIFPYPSGLLHWHCGNLTIAPVPAKQPWWIWINTSWEFIMNNCITTTKQNTTKPCAYFLGYTVSTRYSSTWLTDGHTNGRNHSKLQNRKCILYDFNVHFCIKAVMWFLKSIDNNALVCFFVNGHICKTSCYWNIFYSKTCHFAVWHFFHSCASIFTKERFFIKLCWQNSLSYYKKK